MGCSSSSPIDKNDKKMRESVVYDNRFSEPFVIYNELATTNASQTNDEYNKNSDMTVEIKNENNEIKTVEEKIEVYSNNAEIEVKVEENERAKTIEPVKDVIVPEICTGFLMKQGGTIKTWKKRFVVLENGVLSYYSNETSPGSNLGYDLKGRIDLSPSDRITITDEKNGKLVLSSTMRELPIIVDNKNHAYAWKEAIESHINYVTQISITT